AAAVRGCSLRQILTPVRFENLCCIELVFVIPEVAVASPWTSKSRYSNVYTTGRLFVLGEVGLCIRHPIKPPLLILAVSWFEGAVLKRSCPYTLSLHQNVPKLSKVSLIFVRFARRNSCPLLKPCNPAALPPIMLPVKLVKPTKK